MQIIPSTPACSASPLKGFYNQDHFVARDRVTSRSSGISRTSMQHQVAQQQGLLQSRMCSTALLRAGSYIISLLVICCLTYILATAPLGTNTSQQAAHSRLLLAATVDSAVPAISNSSSSPHTTISSHTAQPVWVWGWRSSLALLLATINSVTAACTGQGGTPFLVPIFTGLMRMSTNSAVACTSFVIFLGSIPSLHHAMTAAHPARPGTPLVDYTFLSLVIPPILVGIKLGVVLNAMSPEWLISFLLIAAYGYSTWKQVAATLRMRRQEKQVALVTARIEALVAPKDASAAAAAAGDGAGATPALPGELSNQQKMSQLQDDIQQLSLLSHNLLQMQAERLPPRVLQRTTSSTIAAVLNNMAPVALNSSLSMPYTTGSAANSTQYGHTTSLTTAHRFGLAGSSSSKQGFAAKTFTFGSSGSGGKRSSMIARYGGTLSGSKAGGNHQAADCSTSQGDDVIRSSWGDQGTPVKQAAAAGRLASSGRQMTQHLRLSLSRADADAAASSAAGRAFERSVTLAGVSASPQQLLQLGRVLSRASTITDRLNTVHSRSRVVRSDLLTQLTASADDTKDVDAAALLQEPAAIATRSQTIAATADVELGCRLSSSPPDSQAAPTGRSTNSIAAMLGRILNKIKQRCRDVPRAAAAWWRMQPKQLLLLVAVSFALYICLTGSMAMLHKCSMGWVAVQLVFAAASVVLTVVSTWLQWGHGSDQEPMATTAVPLNSAPPAAAAGVPHCSSTAARNPALLSMIMESFDSAAFPSSSSDETAGCQRDQTTAHAPHEQAAAALAVPPAASCCSLTCSESEDFDDDLSDDNLKAAVGSSCADEAAGAALLVASPYAEIEWTHRRLLYFPWLMFAAGVVSGLLGATPNTLFLAPYLMMAGCDPHVASATLKLALFLTAGSSTLGYLLQGQLILSFGLAFGIANLLTTPLGQWAMDVIIGRTCQSSLIFFVGTARVIVAMPLLVLVNGLPGALDLAHGHNVAFSLQRLCV